MKPRHTLTLPCLLFCACLASAADGADAATSPQSPAVTLDQFAWLAGNWTLTEGQAMTEEIWTAPSSNLMLGMSYRRNADGSLDARIEGSDNGKAFVKDYAYRRTVP